MCKGRKGLIMHQRSCKMYKSLRLPQNLTDNNRASPEESTSTPNHGASSSSTSAQAVVATESAFSSVKLPKTPAQWSEANTFFQLQRKHLPSLNNINEFTIKFQKMMYYYFAQNYVTINTHTDQNNITNKSIKELKNKLKHLKVLGNNNHYFDNQITNTNDGSNLELLSPQQQSLVPPSITPNTDKRANLPNVNNIDNFTNSLQSLIYDYFASNYGTLETKTISFVDQNKPINKLKKELKQLKVLGQNNHNYDLQIKALSKEIGSRLSALKAQKKYRKNSDITNQLQQKFWPTCKKLFNP
ncbi:hypothetical protein HELRODRAFT_173177 [Helobdella robusta]|uniref:Uncharacterized protein n=1 Tax=Helobdella robusta TaxID=6412 RepID=T1F6I7_HELRO|nr:hypothetical protein HELRODRAFT_173177 [Helobdella robusta]ESO04099.1 hypothetical protein HELRODRAFT_173177 [Helobdella robusta]